MARKRKEPPPEVPYSPFSEFDRRGRVSKRDVDPIFERSVIRDAFLEGKDALAVTMLREMDGRADIKIARKAVLSAENTSKNMPPNCMGAIPAIVRGFEQLAIAQERLAGIPHEMRAPNSILFGKRVEAEKKLTAIRDYATTHCTGSIHDRPLTGGPMPHRRKARR